MTHTPKPHQLYCTALVHAGNMQSAEGAEEQKEEGRGDETERGMYWRGRRRSRNNRESTKTSNKGMTDRPCRGTEGVVGGGSDGRAPAFLHDIG